MIVQRRLDAWRTLRFVGPLLAALLVYDVAVTVLYMRFEQRWLAMAAPLPLLGTAIALVVGFRNNAAYARWWEARMLWGGVINNSRSLARGVLGMIDDRGIQHSMIRQQIAFALALRCHLLRIPAWDSVTPHLSAEAAARLAGAANLPAAIQMEMAGEIAGARRRQALGDSGAGALDRTLSELANALGGLERIKNTPMPRQYSHIPRLFTRVFCVLLPLGLVSDLGWLTPIGSTVVGLMFLALDQVGRNLEDPFEGTNHDVPMLAMTRTIEIDLLRTLGVAELPAPIVPVRGVLA